MKRTIKIICLLTVCILAAAAGAYFIYSGVHGFYYRGYKVVKSVKRKDTATAKYTDYNGKILKYSRDGVSVIDPSGKTVYNASYDMNEPAADVSGKYFAIADIGGKDAVVSDGSSDMRTITTDYEIQQVTVSETGIVAFMMADADTNIVNIYDLYSDSQKLLVQIPVNVDNGLPVDIDISPDADNLICAYISADSVKIKSQVVFYDFSDVGKNSNYLVGVKKYSDRIIGDVSFLNGGTAAVFDDGGFTLWQNFKSPREKKDVRVKGQIRSVFYDSRHLGYINRTNGKNSTVHVYDLKGNEQTKKDADIAFSNVELCGKNLIFTSDDTCMIMWINGNEKFRYTSEDADIKYLLPADGKKYFFLLNQENISYIKLRLRK